MVSGLVTSPCDQLRIFSGDARLMRMASKSAIGFAMSKGLERYKVFLRFLQVSRARRRPLNRSPAVARQRNSSGLGDPRDRPPVLISSILSNQQGCPSPTRATTDDARLVLSPRLLPASWARPAFSRRPPP